MNVVLLTSDLSVSSAASGAAARASIALKTAFDVATMFSHVRAEPTSLVLLDLGTPRIDPAQIVAELREAADGGLRVLAFGPHVHEQKLAAARDAGCEEVLTRGQFHANLDAIFRSVTGGPSSISP
jgi:DNA-binding response OmpR family regulator